jgi:hypothetical protein
VELAGVVAALKADGGILSLGREDGSRFRVSFYVGQPARRDEHHRLGQRALEH